MPFVDLGTRTHYKNKDKELIGKTHQGSRGGNEFQFNTLLLSNLSTAHGGRGLPTLSSLNFFTGNAPRIACQASDMVAFDATRHSGLV